MSCLPIRPLELLEGSRAGVELVELEATREVTPARALEQVIGLVVGKGLRRHGCPSLRRPRQRLGCRGRCSCAPTAPRRASRRSRRCGSIHRWLPRLTGGTRQRTLHRSTPRTRPRTGPWPLSGPWYSCAAGERRRLGPGLQGSLKPRARAALGVREVGQAAEQVGLLRRSSGPAAGLAVRWKAARLGRDARPRAVLACVRVPAVVRVVEEGVPPEVRSVGVFLAAGGATQSCCRRSGCGRRWRTCSRHSRPARCPRRQVRTPSSPAPRRASSRGRQLSQKWLLRTMLLLPPAIHIPVPTGTGMVGTTSEPFA